jgi:hypothetical protein
MPLFDLTEFFKLSSVLHYNLSAASLSRYNVLSYIMGGKRLAPDEKSDREKKGIVMESLGYLFRAYRQKRRHLGPMAVLHPLRAAALLMRTLETPRLVDVLTVLYHDVLEDIKPRDFDFLQWKEMEFELFELMDRLEPTEESEIIRRLTCLSRTDHESYYEYVGRLLGGTCGVAETVRIKLADRLDNTLDMRIDLEDPLDHVNFFQTIFQLLFVGNYPGYRPRAEHAPPSAINGAKRLYQLFKNSVLLSLIRQGLITADDPALKVLFEAVAEASLKEAQRTLIHLLGYHAGELNDPRQLLLEAMHYCYSGRSDLITQPDGRQLLDGLFSTYFGHTSKQLLSNQLDLLYQNKALMLEASIAFIVIFFSFLNEPGFYVKGISSHGIEPA